MISDPKIVPRVRLIFVTSTEIFVFSPDCNAFLNFGRNTFSSIVFSNSKSYLFFSMYLFSFLSLAKEESKIALRSTFFAFAFSSSLTLKRSVRPIRSSTLRIPSLAIYSRSSCAINFMKFSTYSGLPLKRLRSSGFCVATPTGQVSKLHTRIITHPIVINGAVAKPNSSAPSNAATNTSRPVISLPSVSIRTRERSPFMINV